LVDTKLWALCAFGFNLAALRETATTSGYFTPSRKEDTQGANKT